MPTGVLKKISDAKIAKQTKQFRAAEKITPKVKSKPKPTPVKQRKELRQPAGETQSQRSARYKELDKAIRDANTRQ